MLQVGYEALEFFPPSQHLGRIVVVHILDGHKSSEMNLIFVHLLGQNSQKHAGQDDKTLPASHINYLAVSGGQDIEGTVDIVDVLESQINHRWQLYAPEIIIINVLEILNIINSVVLEVAPDEVQYLFTTVVFA